MQDVRELWKETFQGKNNLKQAYENRMEASEQPSTKSLGTLKKDFEQYKGAFEWYVLKESPNKAFLSPPLSPGPLLTPGKQSTPKAIS